MLAQAPEQLLGVIERQARALITQQQELSAYQQQVEALQRQVKELEAKAAIGRVAPFRREESKRARQPKRSGRKGGHQGQWRVCPPPSADDEHIEVLLEACPDCGNALERSGERAIEQTIIEAPVVKARVIRLKTYRNECEHCCKQVESRHPLQVSTATGAAGTHLGPRALGLAAALNKDLKLTMRKSCKVLKALLGIELSPGGLSQAMARVAGRLEGEYDKTLAQLRDSEVIHTDETGW
jgi:transposase